MPNWCENDVTIRHSDPAAITRVRDAFKDGRLCMEFIPTADGKWNYDFSVANWGTKWDVGGDVIDETGDEIVLSFQSAWSPPIKLYNKLVELGYEVNAFYWEPGMAYAGIYEDGTDDCYGYGGMSAGKIAAHLPQDLDDCYQISEFVREYEEE